MNRQHIEEYLVSEMNELELYPNPFYVYMDTMVIPQHIHMSIDVCKTDKEKFKKMISMWNSKDLIQFMQDEMFWNDDFNEWVFL